MFKMNKIMSNLTDICVEKGRCWLQINLPLKNLPSINLIILPFASSRSALMQNLIKHARSRNSFVKSQILHCNFIDNVELASPRKKLNCARTQEASKQRSPAEQPWYLAEGRQAFEDACTCIGGPSTEMCTPSHIYHGERIIRTSLDPILLWPRSDTLHWLETHISHIRVPPWGKSKKVAQIYGYWRFHVFFIDKCITFDHLLSALLFLFCSIFPGFSYIFLFPPYWISWDISRYPEAPARYLEYFLMSWWVICYLCYRFLSKIMRTSVMMRKHLLKPCLR